MREIKQQPSPSEIYHQKLFQREGFSNLEKLIQEARRQSETLGKLGISMSHNEARVMATFIQAARCQNFVEIGTLTGATALWIADALAPQGNLWTFEKDERHSQAAGLIFNEYHRTGKTKINLIQGDAVEKLPEIEKFGPFDGIFIDGNKAAYLKYLDWAEKNLKPGALVIGDNVFLGGSVFNTELDSKFSKKQIQVMQEFNQRLADPNRYSSCLILSSEGLLVAVKK